MTAGKVSLMLRMRLFCSLHQPDGKRISVDGKEIGMRKRALFAEKRQAQFYQR